MFNRWLILPVGMITMANNFVSDDVTDRRSGPINRRAEIVIKTEGPNVYIRPHKPVSIDRPDGTKIYILNDIFYRNTSGLMACIAGSTVENVTYTIINEKYLNPGTAYDTFLQDVKLNSMEVTSPTDGYSRVCPLVLYRKICDKYEMLHCLPELYLYTEHRDGTIIKTHIGSTWKDFALLDDPYVSYRGNYIVKAFGYHRAMNDVLTVDSVALFETTTFKTLIANFKQSLQIGSLQSFLE